MVYEKIISLIQEPVLNEISWFQIWMILTLFSVLYISLLWNKDWSQERVVSIVVKTVSWIFLVTISTMIIVVLIRIIAGG